MFEAQFRLEAPHQYVASSHARNLMSRFPADFWEEDIVKEINEVLVDPNHVKVSSRIGQGK